MVKRISVRILGALAFSVAGACAAPALAQGPIVSLYDTPKYAAILVDAKTGEVLYSRRADAERHPASITKVMTLYLAFQALERGELKLDDRITMSYHAVAQAPSKLGLRKGESIKVDDAIRVIATKSANDVAVALAEKLGGSEARFAEMMNDKARDLGMRETHFANATGLPEATHITTARDIALLSMSVLKKYPKYYTYFSQQEFDWGKQKIANHNHLLGKLLGCDGIKTGYTVAAGYTLAASAIRDGRRLIAVVLGGPSTMARDDNVSALLDAGFDVLKRRANGERATVAASLDEPNDFPGFDSPTINQTDGLMKTAVTTGVTPATMVTSLRP